MKKIFLLALTFAGLLAADAQVRTPAPSPSQTVKQDFGLSNVELSYSRPGMKGRKLYVDLAPSGKVWRTGANNATTLTFGDDVTIGGVKIPAGKYGLLTIPDKKTWTIIISKQTNVTNPSAYKQAEDVVRLNVAVENLKDAVETFTINFADIKNTSMNIELLWDKSKVTFPVSTDIDSKVMSSIEKAMKGDKPPYFQAAVYYMENGKDLNQALTWFNKAVEAQPDAYWVQHQWAKCLAKLGQKEEAIAAATRSKELAVKGENADYVKMNEDLIKELK